MLGCDRVFYYPDQRVRCSPADHALQFEDVFFEAEDGVRLHGWFLPAHGNKPRGTVLHIHGNAAKRRLGANCQKYCQLRYADASGRST